MSDDDWLHDEPPDDIDTPCEYTVTTLGHGAVRRYMREAPHQDRSTIRVQRNRRRCGQWVRDKYGWGHARSECTPEQLTARDKRNTNRRVMYQVGQL